MNIRNVFLFRFRIIDSFNDYRKFNLSCVIFMFLFTINNTIELTYIGIYIYGDSSNQVEK